MPKRLKAIIAAVAVVTTVVVAASIALADTLPPPVGQMTTAEKAPTRAERFLIKKKQKTLQRIENKRRATWRCQDISLTSHSGKKGHPERRIKSLRRLLKVSVLWTERRQRACHQAHNPPSKWLWFCLHSWESKDWHNPGVTWQGVPSQYQGGLQMGEGFRNTYLSRWIAKFGALYTWPPLRQVWGAARAFIINGKSLAWVRTQWEAWPHCI